MNGLNQCDKKDEPKYFFIHLNKNYIQIEINIIHKFVLKRSTKIKKISKKISMLEVSYSWGFQVYFLRHVNRHFEQGREKYRNYEHWDKAIKR